MKKRRNNLLDYIPQTHPAVTWSMSDDNRITLHVNNKGFYNRIAQILFKRPKVSHIELDEYGSVVWNNITGQITVEELGKRLKIKFGEKVESLYERLVKYLIILQNNRFIILEKKDRI